MSKDTALDNLWNTTSDTSVYHTVGFPAKMVKKSGDTLMGKRNKVQGYMTYFLPKDKKGKIIGKPQKFLRIQKLGKSTGDFIPANLVTPYYEDILNNKSYWISLGGANLVSLAQSKLSGAEIASKFQGGFDVTNGDSLGEFSNFNIGEFLGKTFGGKKTALQQISDPNVSVVDAKTMNQAYKESGTKRPLLDWLNSEGGKGILDEVSKLINVAINKPQGGLPTDNTPTDNTPTDDTPKDDTTQKTETTILGMSPVTFGIVAVGLILVSSIVAYKIIKGKQAKLTK
jgi:hypothetical protein